MWAVISAGMRYLAGLIFSAGAIKMLATGFIFFIFSIVVDIAIGLVDAGGPNSATSLVAGWPSDLLFYLDLLQLDLGIVMILGAWATRFAIRRIPIIG